MANPLISLRAPFAFDEDEPDTRRTAVPEFDVDTFAHEEHLAAAGRSRKSESPRALGVELESGVLPVGFGEESASALERGYVGRLGSLTKVPVLRLTADEYRELALEPSAAFLISNMDGICSVEILLDIAGMGRLEALRILVDLIDEHVIELC